MTCRAAMRAYDLAPGPDEAFDRIVRLTADRLGCAMAFVVIGGVDGPWVKAAYRAGAAEKTTMLSLIAETLGAREVVVVADVTADPALRSRAGLPDGRTIERFASAPLSTPDGDVIGRLCVADLQPGACDADKVRALGDFAAITMDAVDLRDAIGQAERVQHRLALSDARHRSIVDTAVDAIITIGADGIIQSTNRAAEHLFGHPSADMVGRNVAMLMPEPHHCAHDGYLSRYLENGAPRIIGIGREVPCLRADGSLFNAELAVSESVVAGVHTFTGILRDLTRRQEAEAVLRQHIELVRLAEEAAHVGHWRLDVVTEDLFWSDEVYRIHGVDPAHYRPTVETALAFYEPDTKAQVEAAVTKAMESLRPFEFEVDIIRPSGEARIVYSHGSPQADDTGRVIALVGTFQDVTDRVRMAQDLERSRERLERSTSYTNIGIWEWDMAGGHLWWSDRIAPLLGLGPGDGAVATQFETFMGAVHPDDRTVVQDAIEAAVDGRAAYEVEHRVVWPDGTVRWMQERGAVERADDGTPLRMLGVVQDVTRAKEAELALKDSEGLLAMSIDNISEGFVLIDDRDRLVLWNERLLEIFPRLRPYIAVGAPFADTVRGAAEDGQYVNAVGRVDAWLAERMTQHGEAEEIREEPLEGGRWVRVAERRMGNGWRVGIRTDITELRRAREEAQAANRAKSNFLSKMSHELRTPLNAILGFAQLLQANRQDPLTPAQTRHVGHILDGGYHLLSLINEVLDLARIESGGLALTLQSTDPAPIINDCLGMAETLGAPRRIAVTLKEPQGGAALPAVLADPTRLRQILLNLLSNAVKYNHEEGSVTMIAQRHGAALRFSVVDTGPGLDAEAQVKIFEPFNRMGAEMSGIEGAGIGLTITHQLVELMNGTIGVDSAPGEGATFWVEIPLADTRGECA